MRIERLELVNFCQHALRTIDFQPGLTAIIGPNGSGKSNILGALKYAVTGAHPNTGGKEANIRQGAPSSERASVSLTFTHGSVRADVRRNLRPATPATVVVGGVEQARGDRAVNAWILSLLATDTQILNDIVIVDQEEIFGFLSQRPAARAASFAKLFHTDAAETAWKAVGNHLTGVQIPRLPVDLAVVNQTLAADAARLTEIIESLGDDDSKSVRAEIGRHQQVMDSWRARCAHLQQAGDLRSRRVPLIQQHTDAQEALAKIHAAVQSLQAAATDAAPLAVAAREALVLVSRATHYAGRKRELEGDIQRLQQVAAALHEPAEPEEYGKDLPQALATLAVKQSSYQQFVESFDPQTGTTMCPTCGTPVASLQAQLAVARAQLPVTLQAMQEVRTLIRQHTSFEVDLQRVKAEQRRCRESLVAKQEQLDTLQMVTTTSTEPTRTLQLRVASHDEFLAAVKTYQGEIPQRTAAVAQLAGQLQELDPQIVAAETAAANISVTTEQASAAQRDHACASTRLTAMGPLEQERIEVNTRMRHYQRLQVQCADAAREIAVKTDWVKRAQRMRDVLHRDAAPKAVAQRNLSRLEQGINAQLEMFNTDYRISSDLTLSFIAYFNDGREQPASRLSVGQKVILALSFRLAVNFMYADLGFLALDEPTAYLDAHHIAGFEPVLGRLREFVASRGLQCVMVTHEQDLAPLFDSVIQL